jgi:hypothetical protein
MEVSNQPQLSLRQVGGRFGFSPPIVPPGTEPDLQALNNSFVAAANSANQRLTSSNTTSHNIPATISTDSSSQPALPRTSSVTQSHPQFYETVGPALQSISQEARGDHHVIPVATSDNDLSRPVLSRAPSMIMASQSHPTLRLINQEAQGDRYVIPVATSDDNDLSWSVLSRAPSVTMAHQPHPQFYETIDPALRPISQGTQGDHHVIPVATSNDADLL